MQIIHKCGKCGENPHERIRTQKMWNKVILKADCSACKKTNTITFYNIVYQHNEIYYSNLPDKLPIFIDETASEVRLNKKTLQQFKERLIELDPEQFTEAFPILFDSHRIPKQKFFTGLNKIIQHFGADFEVVRKIIHDGKQDIKLIQDINGDRSEVILERQVNRHSIVYIKGHAPKKQSTKKTQSISNFSEYFK